MGLGSVSISDQTIDFIRSILPAGSTILEFGSGAGTIALSEYYTMYSVENQHEWMDRYPLCTTYINCGTKPYDAEFTAPDIVGPQTAWYDPADLLPNLPKEYDLILVDGPGGHFGRGGFFKYLDEFNTSIPLLFDDINRPHDFDLMVQVSKVLDRPYKVIYADLGYIAYEN
jgi:hypothetical protein|tara:strand:- start:164 stop:676 length:513 start_codon:yes stop_codon:yes gene_type:complete